jgi:hypothetical protein
MVILRSANCSFNSKKSRSGVCLAVTDA